MLSEDAASEALEKRGSDSVAYELGGLGGSDSERIGSVTSCNSLLSFFLHVSQIFEPMEICGALSHIQAVTGLRFFLRLLQVWPGISKGLQ